MVQRKAKEYQRSCRFELPQGTDPPFFHDFCLEFPSIPEALLQSLVNNTIRPINVIKLSTDFSEGKTDKDEDQEFGSADIKGINHPPHCFIIYSLILFWTVPPGVQSPLIAAFLAFIDWLFGLFNGLYLGLDQEVSPDLP